MLKGADMPGTGGATGTPGIAGFPEMLAAAVFPFGNTSLQAPHLSLAGGFVAPHCGQVMSSWSILGGLKHIESLSSLLSLSNGFATSGFAALDYRPLYENHHVLGCYVKISSIFKYELPVEPTFLKARRIKIA